MYFIHGHIRKIYDCFLAFSQNVFSDIPVLRSEREVLTGRRRRNVLRLHHPQGNQTRNKIGNIRRGKGKLQVTVAVPLQVKVV